MQQGMVDSTSFYVYEAQALTLAVGGTASDQIAIEADANFVWVKSAYFADVAGAAQTDATRVVPNVDVQLVDTSSGRQLLNGNTPIPSIFGDGRLPFVMPIPQELKANSVLRVDFFSREAVITPNIRLALIGWKDFGKVMSTRAARG